MITHTSTLQTAIETVEHLSLEEQAQLLEIIYRRLVALRREQLIDEVLAARQAYQLDQVRRGTVDDLMADLTE